MTITDFDLLIFDADGTLRECILPEPPCPDRPWEWALLPDVKGHECWSNPAKIAIASNQGGVGLGIIEEKIARQMLRDLFVELVGIQPKEWQIQMCPHLPDAGCLCCKPEPQMLIAAMKAAGVDGGRVLYVGDSETDQRAAIAAGVEFRWSEEFFGASGRSGKVANDHPICNTPQRSTSVLEAAARHAATYVETLPYRPVAPTITPEELRLRLAKPLPETGVAPEKVIDELVRDIDDGILRSNSGRFFGWVIGGVLPVALAADWLTSAWDQNAASNLTSPAEAVVEEICGEWVKALLGIPKSASFAFVTGCQMAHTTALASARHKLLRDRGWDVEKLGLTGAPQVRILTTENRHESIMRSVRLLGIGTDAVGHAPTDNEGRIDIEELKRALRRWERSPVIVCLQAGDLHTGIFDPFERACRVAHAANAWVHIDGAFGLWVGASERYRHLVNGVDQADSWATDGHKWLNLPFDSGIVFVAHPWAHRAAFAQSASYSIPREELRNQKDWNPEWSRRGRGFTFYAAIRALGRSGIGEIVDRCCAHAARLVKGIGGLPGAEVVATPVINQGLVRFLSDTGDHDSFTDDVIGRIQAKGVAWFGGATWHGMRVMRVSVCNWATTDSDIDRALASVREALTDARLSAPRGKR